MADIASSDLNLQCHQRVMLGSRRGASTTSILQMSADRPSPTVTTKCHGISNGRFGRYDVEAALHIAAGDRRSSSLADDSVFYPAERIELIASDRRCRPA